MLRRRLLAAPALLLAPRAHAVAAGPLVVELFTSQGCSSCPPADALLTELSARPDVLPLSFHVTYWDRLGWRDPFSLPEATERQRRYAGTLRGASLGEGQVYTPQVVVQGARDAVGSDRRALLAALEAARPAAVPLVLAADGDNLAIAVGEGAGSGLFWLVGFDRMHSTAVGRGENGGRRLSHSNVVRSLVSLGAWQGRPSRLSAPRPAGERAAVLLQAADGHMLGAAVLA
jgi:hypothetical protein